ncbi:MAG: SsrA-binding protein SmpB [Myxococcota bacterium]
MPKEPGVKLIAKNRKALFDYEVVDAVEAGLVLRGTEVKSLRDGKMQFADSFASAENGELWLHRAHIAEYTQGNVYNHEPTRSRKLLLHRHQIERLASRSAEKGLTLIPLEVYFKDGRAKVKLGLCRGKAKHDKRASIRERDEKRALARARDD